MLENSFIIKNALIVNEGQISEGDVTIRNGRIEKIGTDSNAHLPVLDINGDYLLPGIIDDQVHFREPGLTHKATIHTESMAAAAGGVTSFMEMPNTNPPATTLPALEEKYAIAAQSSVVNYSFFMGGSNDNLPTLLEADYENICGIKLFMGSSTGNLLVDDEEALDSIFKAAPVLIATHCEDESTIKNNLQLFKDKYGDNLTPDMHPLIRSAQGCLISSQKAVNLAKKHGTRLHILHISTGIETELFDGSTPLEHKKITAEACVHHMTFSDRDYAQLGNLIKCNPAIKTEDDRKAIIYALKSGAIDIVATDHAPHTLEEKALPYLLAPSGLPLVQHSLRMMLRLAESEAFGLTDIVRWMCHAPAVCFKVRDRGFIRENYFADLVRLDANTASIVTNDEVLYKCGWTPLAGQSLPGKIMSTWVNGRQVYDGHHITGQSGMRLTFQR